MISGLSLSINSAKTKDLLLKPLTLIERKFNDLGMFLRQLVFTGVLVFGAAGIEFIDDSVWRILKLLTVATSLSDDWKKEDEND